MRKVHYWKKGKSLSLPSAFVVVDTETLPEPAPKPFRAAIHKLRLGCALSYRLERGRRTREARLTFRTAGQFWEFLDRRCGLKNTTWVVCHNAAFDLGVLGAWRRFTGDDWLFSKLVIDDGVFYLAGRFRGRPVVFVDSLNYYRCSLEEMGVSVGVHKLPMPDFAACDADWEHYCWQDVEVTAAAIDRLLSFWRENDLGPWGPTISSLAFSAFRSRFMHEKVLVHCNQDALRLERAAYYGGRVDCAYIGTVPASPVWECDYSSLYPWCCLKELPTRLHGMSGNCSHAGMGRLLERFLCTAEVSLNTPTLPFPLRTKERVIHATGCIRTILPDPELRRAHDAGLIGRVYKVATYEHAPLFRDYMEHFYSLKSQYESSGDIAFRTIAKILMNSLYGKTGQRGERWVTWGREALALLAERYGVEPESLYHYLCINWREAEYQWHLLCPELPEPVSLRNLWGSVEVCVGHTEGRESCPAIAGTVTSYGRLRLSEAQQTAGARRWFYSDTDSIWVDHLGIANLHQAGLVKDGAMGLLAQKDCVARLVIHGPKDYEADGAVKIKGVRKKAVQTGEGEFEQDQFPSAKSQLREPIDEGIVIKRITKRLKRSIDGCVVGSDGWTTPHHFSRKAA